MNEKKNLMMYLVSIYRYKIYRKLASMLIKALCILIRVVHVKSKTLYEEDGEDMYEKDLLYITTYMYMILSLHELISRCHLVNFDLLPPSTFKIHNMTQFCVFVFFLIKKHHDSVYFVVHIEI